jgi:glutamate dehydrogenase
MSLNLFVYGKPRTTRLEIGRVREIAQDILKFAAKVQAGEEPDLEPNPSFEESTLIEYMTKCTETYLRIGCDEPHRYLRQVQYVHQVTGTDGTEVQISESREPGHYWVDVAVCNSMPQVVLENLCRLLYLHRLDVTRARLDIIPVEEGSTVTMLRTLVTPYKSVDIPPGTFEHLVHEMKRSKWLDPLTHELVFEKFPEIGVTRGEIITALCAAVHPVLSKTNAVAFSNTNIFNTISNPRFIGHAAAVADLFIDRFRPSNPLRDPEEFDKRCHAICASVDSDVEDSIACEILMKMINVVRHTLKTNLFMPDRYALSLRLDPACMAAPADNNRELPYGVLFVHGRRFNGFHVRFRDIARGGLRLVTPKSEEQLALESARQYDECYGLAFAQQLKNKDIPEGGSKAVCLIHTAGLSDTAKYFVMRKSVKAMTDAILDLIVTTDYTQQNMIDYWKKKEVLYLGPDEQVIPEDIEWIVKRAAARGCKYQNKIVSFHTPALFLRLFFFYI